MSLPWVLWKWCDEFLLVERRADTAFCRIVDQAALSGYEDVWNGGVPLSPVLKTRLKLYGYEI